MLQLYYFDATENQGISIHEPLFSSTEQALEIFEIIADDTNSFLGIISHNKYAVQFSKYNKFVWLVEIPHQTKKGCYQIFLTPNKAKNLIEDIYKGFNPLKINGLMFEQK